MFPWLVIPTIAVGLLLVLSRPRVTYRGPGKRIILLAAVLITAFVGWRLDAYYHYSLFLSWGFGAGGVPHVGVITLAVGAIAGILSIGACAEHAGRYPG